MTPGARQNWVDFSAVKRAVSLEAVLRHYQVQDLLRRHPDQLQGCCPIHDGKRDDSFRAHLTKMSSTASPARHAATCWIS